LPCAWFFLLIDFWPVYKGSDKDGENKKDISEFSPSQLESLGMSYANNS